MGRAGAGRYWLIWAAVIPVVVWAVVRTFGLERGFPAVPLIAYTPYAAVAAILVAGVATALRNWPAALISAVATVCLLGAVLPRAVGDGTVTAEPGKTLRVLSANVHFGKADPEDLVEMVERLRPDVLVVQELRPRFARELRWAGIERSLPDTVLLLHPWEPGAGFYSRLQIRLLAGTKFSLRMPWAEITLPNGDEVRMVNAHPYTPKRKSVGLWRAGLRDLPSTGRGTPWVLAGDFNATLDHAELRKVLDRGYRDAADVTGRGLEATWPSNRALPPPVTIDHVLADERIGIVDYGVEDLSGSDHRAIYATLALP